MFKRIVISPFALALAFGGCGGDEGSSADPDMPSDEAMPGDDSDVEDGDDSDSDPPSTLGNSNQPEPFVTEFEGIVEQAAPWSGLEIAITGARKFRGEKPEGFEGLFFTAGTYAELDVKITQLGNNDTDYSTRDTWDLILADGTRERPLNNIGLVIGPGDSPTAHLYYSASDGLEFAGAMLEVNGGDRTTLEPMRIPLDAPATFESVAEVPSLVGQTVLPTAPEGELSFEILEATYGVNLPAQNKRAPFDQRLFRLVIRVSYSGNFSESFNSVNDGPKLIVDGDEIAGDEGEIDTIPSGGSVDFPTLFLIDETVTELEIELDTQDGTPARLPVTLPAL